MKSMECNPIKENGLFSSNVNLLNLFWELQNGDKETRLTASSKLTSAVLMSQNQCGCEEISSELEYTFSRLIQGLSSGRKIVHISFSTALTHLLKNIPSALMSSKRFLYLINDQLSWSGKHLTKKGVKEVYIAQLFCLLSLIRSRRLVDDNDEESVSATVEALIKLSRKKSNLKMLSYRAIQDLVVQVDDECFNNSVWTLLFPLFKTGWSQCTIEALLLLLICLKHHPKTCGNQFLKGFKWVENDSCTILSKPKFSYFAQLFAKTTSCHPNIDQCAVEVVSLFNHDNRCNFVEFWTDSLEETLFSSPERKYLALTIAVKILNFLSHDQVLLIWSKRLSGYMLYALSDKRCCLHSLCQKKLWPMLIEKLKKKKISGEVQYAFVHRLFSSFLVNSFDKSLCTTPLDGVIEQLDLEPLGKHISWLRKVFMKENDIARKWSCNQLAQLMKLPTLQLQEDWLCDILKFLFFHCYFTVVSRSQDTLLEEVCEVDVDFLPVSPSVRNSIYYCFVSAMKTVLERTLSSHKRENSVPGMMLSGKLWISHFLNYVDSLLSLNDVIFNLEWDKRTQQYWRSAMKNLNHLSKSRNSQAGHDRALELLFACVTFQLLDSQSRVRKQSMEVFDDLDVIINERSLPNLATSATNLNSNHWIEVVVEIIISLLLSESSIVRSCAEQAFRILSPHITKKGLQLIFDVLGAKDELELMEADMNGDSADVDEDTHVEEGDIESSNDEGDQADDEDVTTDDEDDDLQDNEIDEQFRSDIRKALGSAVDPLEEISDNSVESDEKELDDEEMMKLDPILSEVFKQRKKHNNMSNKKQVLEFQARCLSLLEIFLSRCYDNIALVLDLPLPLLTIIEQASVDQRKANIAERASVILRMKVCQLKNLPRNLDAVAVKSCYDNISKILQMIIKGNRGMFMNQLMSQCCMFYVRTLSRQDIVDSAEIYSLYLPVLDDFMLRRQSKVQHFVLLDFVRNYPEISHPLAEKLVKLCEKAVQPYRKIQSCLLLSSLYQTKSVRQYMTSISPSLLDNLENMLGEIASGVDDANSKGLLQFIQLLHFPVQCLKNEDKSWDFSKLTDILITLLSNPVVTRSTKILAHLWKVLQLLGISRPRKEKKKSLNSSGARWIEVATTEKSTPKESTRQLKQRVMKEKKKAAGKGKKTRVKSKEQKQKNAK